MYIILCPLLSNLIYNLLRIGTIIFIIIYGILSKKNVAAIEFQISRSAPVSR